MLQRVRIHCVDSESGQDRGNKPTEEVQIDRWSTSVGPTIRHCVQLLRNIAGNRSDDESRKDIVTSLVDS